LGRQLPEQPRPVGDGEVGARQVEGGLRAVEAAVADQQDDDAFVRAARAARSVNAFSTASRVARLSASSVTLASGTASFFFACVDEAGRPFLELRRVLFVAGDAGDHEQVRLLRKGGRRTQQAAQKQTHD
jgi:hypothetical protein